MAHCASGLTPRGREGDIWNEDEGEDRGQTLMSGGLNGLAGSLDIRSVSRDGVGGKVTVAEEYSTEGADD